MDEIYCRCSYCNTVSSPEIMFYPEQYKPKIMITVDPQDSTKMICEECLSVVRDALYEFEDDEETEAFEYD